MRGSRRRLPRSFYARSPQQVARDLLGRDLVRTLPDGQRLVARIVEAEAYQESDPASHSFRGKTPRTEVMFGPPGRLYVYFTYGMHFCMNVVTGRDGEGSAALLRAARPLEGLDEMARRRRLETPRLLCAGPGRLTQALGIARPENGIDVVRGPELIVTEGEPVPDDRILVGPRVGVNVAVEEPWRFMVEGDPFVSRGPVRLPSGPAVARPRVRVRGSRTA